MEILETFKPGETVIEEGTKGTSAYVILSGTVDVIKRFKPGINQKQVLLISRWGIVVLGLGSLGLALALKGVINSLLFAYTIYTAGIIIPVIAGFYREKLKVTPAGALAAVLGGGTAALISKITGIEHLDLGSLAIGGVLLFGVSFIDNAFKKEKHTKLQK